MERISEAKRKLALYFAIAALVLSLLGIISLLDIIVSNISEFGVSVLVAYLLVLTAPIILTIFHILSCNKSNSRSKLLVAYGIMLLFYAFAAITGCVMIIRYGLQQFADIFGVILCLFLLAGPILGMAATINGFFNKKLVYASAICMFLCCIPLLILSFLSIVRSMDWFALFFTSSFVLFTVSLLILGLNITYTKQYKLPDSVSGVPNAEADPFFVLQTLEEDFRCGKIDSEEYSARRAEIIKKL